MTTTISEISPSHYHRPHPPSHDYFLIEGGGGKAAHGITKASLSWPDRSFSDPSHADQNASQDISCDVFQTPPFIRSPQISVLVFCYQLDVIMHGTSGRARGLSVHRYDFICSVTASCSPQSSLHAAWWGIIICHYRSFTVSIERRCRRNRAFILDRHLTPELPRFSTPCPRVCQEYRKALFILRT